MFPTPLYYNDEEFSSLLALGLFRNIVVWYEHWFENNGIKSRFSSVELFIRYQRYNSIEYYYTELRRTYLDLDEWKPFGWNDSKKITMFHVYEVNHSIRYWIYVYIIIYVKLLIKFIHLFLFKTLRTMKFDRELGHFLTSTSSISKLANIVRIK